ncbi:SLC13 family permease [Arthrobacter sp. zg-Y877]|uniref:GntP family permease n=1 Tax=Arthrobacter sp. zg-Y877 TaxID=3049074 RepID=UPI0025A33BA5|nr:SLC13 family permease [Arthrobacter sp. zg-Y877]MDM7990649.1 SLC13 family permease [Arthrobacter sp. zg-Y877]
MDNGLLLLHTAITIVGIIVLIVKLKVHPAYALIFGILYLGIAAGLGLTGTLEALTGGFGEILAKIGLLIAFGITMGTALSEMGAIDRIVKSLLRIFGKQRSPYALGVTAGTALQAIFADVMLVVTAPVARGLARNIGRNGIPRVAAALVCGILVGLVMMIPSVGSLALSGVIGIPLWRYLLFGTAIGVVTIIATIFLMNLLISHTRFWNAATDEDWEVMDKLDAASAEETFPAAPVTGASSSPDSVTGGSESRTAVLPGTAKASTARPLPPIWLSLTPLVLTLVLVALGSLADVFGIEVDALAFFADPTIALLLGSFVSLMIVLGYKGQDGVKRALDSSFTNLGEVLVLTGLGGSLASLVKVTGLGDVLADFFSASAGPPILLAWLIAVVLHVAIGSVSVAAITSAGILAPVAAMGTIDPILIALAAGAGSVFFMTVHSNFFWMSKNLLGQTTKGAVKIVGVTTSLASVIGLAAVLLLGIFL